jgi:hypothetical protein
MGYNVAALRKAGFSFEEKAGTLLFQLQGFMMWVYCGLEEELKTVSTTSL